MILKPNKVDISTDKSSIESMVKQFIDGYNALQDKMDELGKRNSIVGGVRQDDGGALAGDASTRTISNFMDNTVTGNGLSTHIQVIEIGIKMDNKGKLSLEEKFGQAVDKNFDQVVALFGVNGLAGTLNKGLKVYQVRWHVGCKCTGEDRTETYGNPENRNGQCTIGKI
ncbi:flagellar filament capping protein FliD [Aeromonas sp. A-5]|uniref:flagellar filament capping protein FliD n=1 Tax=Aeromonas ichthyocola TaxID=3367746 RepID=UPI0038D8E3DB